MTVQQVLMVALKVTPTVLLWLAVDGRLRTTETRLVNLRAQVVRLQAELIRHGGSAEHWTLHPSMN